MTRSTCIGHGCDNTVDKAINPFWCPDCNDKRIKRITRLLDDMQAEFDGRFVAIEAEVDETR